MSRVSKYIDLSLWGPGRTFLVGGTAVLAGLSSFYLGMVSSKRHQVAEGRNPYYEYSVGHVTQRPRADDVLPNLSDRYSDMPPAFRGKDHHHGKYTLTQYKQTPDYVESEGQLRYMVPSPQRPGEDHPDRPYTKAPDYARNYEKTPGHALKTEPLKVDIEIDHA